jgi:hypothetical protein
MSIAPRKPRLAVLSALVMASASCAAAGAAMAAASITTYHNDNTRSGWNQQETVLTPSSVKGGTFGMIASDALDDQSDTQPLVVPGLSINGGTHDVVYVATESDSIYAVDANNGQVLIHANFGSPVPQGDLPGGCGNNGPNIGIDGTPVIDTNAGVMYVITYTLENGHQTYRIHELSLTTLQDTIPSVIITASAKLNNGSTFNFQAAQNRQRPGLLLSNGNVYAGFGSFCDIDANVSRGWVLGWQKGTLTPLAANHLNNQLASSPDNFFLTAIWMSGYGLAANTGGDIYFVTGNSDYSGNTYNKKTNLAESVVELSSDLTKVEDFFTPGGAQGAGNLDRGDTDFGSGGVTLLPPQTGSKVSDFAVAAGKDGNLYLLNADKLGKDKKYLNRNNVGGCWCGQSYYVNASNAVQVVTSGGGNVNYYTLNAASKSLSHRATSSSVPGGQDPGFFTSVSSNGTNDSTAVVWAVSRPTDGDPADISLYAFDENGSALYSGLAGTWPNTGGNSNTVPTVANGKVYVASYQSLAIFGLSNNAKRAQLPQTSVKSMIVPLAPSEHEIHGTVRSMNGNLVTIATRSGELVTIDSTQAEKMSRMAQPSVGNGLVARGAMTGAGIFNADTIMHAKKNPAIWQPDR